MQPWSLHLQLPSYGHSTAVNEGIAVLVHFQEDKREVVVAKEGVANCT